MELGDLIMNIKMLLVGAVLLVSGAAQAETNWYRVTANSLLFVDMLQTVEISKNERFHEKNPILGTQPTEREVYQYFAMATLLVNLIGESIPDEHRDNFYIATAVVQSKVVFENIQLGVKIKF